MIAYSKMRDSRHYLKGVAGLAYLHMVRRWRMDNSTRLNTFTLFYRGIWLVRAWHVAHLATISDIDAAIGESPGPRRDPQDNAGHVDLVAAACGRAQNERAATLDGGVPAHPSAGHLADVHTWRNTVGPDLVGGQNTGERLGHLDEGRLARAIGQTAHGQAAPRSHRSSGDDLRTWLEIGLRWWLGSTLVGGIHQGQEGGHEVLGAGDVDTVRSNCLLVAGLPQVVGNLVQGARSVGVDKLHHGA